MTPRDFGDAEARDYARLQPPKPSMMDVLLDVLAKVLPWGLVAVLLAGWTLVVWRVVG